MHLSGPAHLDSIEGISKRDCDSFRKRAISICNGSHDDDTMVVLWCCVVLLQFKEVRAEGNSVVVIV